MSNWVRVALFIVAQIAISQLVIHVLAPGLPTDPIDWPKSLGWGSMMILPLALTTIHYFRSRRWQPLAAASLCAFAWCFGYLSHFNSQWHYMGFFLPANIFVYAAFGFLLDALNHKWSARIGWIIAVFGAVLIVPHGWVITTDEAFYERLAWCILVALQTIEPAAKAIGRRDDPQEKSFTPGQYVRLLEQERKKAA
jgi:peptidoglycan/LPS O-acetylase OafA/YrhL